MPSYSSWLRQGSFTSEQSINQILQAAFSILTYEKVSFAFFCSNLFLTKIISDESTSPSGSVNLQSRWHLPQIEEAQSNSPSRCKWRLVGVILADYFPIFWRFLDPNYISLSSMYKPASTPLSRLSYYIYFARLYRRCELYFHVYLLTHPLYSLRIHTWSRNMAKSIPLSAASRECMLRKPYLKVSLVQRFWLGDSNWIVQMNIHTSYGTPQTWPMCSAAQYL